jgi:hypothetical protein
MAAFAVCVSFDDNGSIISVRAGDITGGGELRVAHSEGEHVNTSPTRTRSRYFEGG